jgi:hypothetical protein
MPSFGLKMIDPDGVDGSIFVEIYQHKSLDPNPTVMLDANRDEKWYHFFQNQFDVLWSSSRTATPADGYKQQKEVFLKSKST